MVAFLSRHGLAVSSLKYTSFILKTKTQKVLGVLEKVTELQRPFAQQPVERATEQGLHKTLQLGPPGGAMSKCPLWRILLFNSQSL